ncbi:MAG TPA: lipase family protein [Microbacterium sp.]|uniref:lipase family protein n=1 Tax=Microbacterium sp. TaxID=51671 RepID=UPI002BE798D1|nr:lipase family protein [Microbacterium sp.]HWI31425.1 lipase family protein [Microbacterium sp.]
MTSAPRSPARQSRWERPLRLVERAPGRVAFLIGAALALLGVFIVTRPLTSLWVLGVYVGLSAILTGIVDLGDGRRTPLWWNRVASAVWIVGGLVILIWLGRSLELLPDALAVLLVFSGIGSLTGVARGRASERVLAVAAGVSQIAFGALALLWPDVTLLIVAVLFGVRTIISGVALAWRSAGRVWGRPPAAVSDMEPLPRRRIWGDIARYAAAVLLVAIASSAWALNGWLADGAPVVDAFYEPPRTVPLQPGALIRVGDYAGRSPSGGDVRRILYTTTDTFGRDAVASALVIVPTDPPPGPRPVISWNHGTTGVARGCAPSLMDGSATKWAIPAVEEALARGWVVVGTDYSGQGTAGDFPYLIGPGEARSSIDAVRAAREIDDLALSDDIVAWGHSQGGHAALWTEPVAADYAPDLRIRGTAALAPVADPLAVAGELTRADASTELSILISWVLVPYADLYPDVNLEDYVATSGRAIVREMTQRCLSEPGLLLSAITSLGVSADRPLYPADLTSGALGRRLAQNVPQGPWEAPLLIAWGREDEVIPPHVTREYVATLCEGETAVRWIPYDATDHRGILMPESRFLSTLIRWTEDRFARNDEGTDFCRRS